MARVSLQRLGQQLHKRRKGRGIREVAAEIGISSATLSRVERGNLPDLETFAKICKWMEVDPAEVLDIPTNRALQPPGVSTVVATAHFRANRTVSPALAGALANMILAASHMLATEDSLDEE
jgi:transcriptional regulator with XRE-family HTH domain